MTVEQSSTGSASSNAQRDHGLLRVLKPEEVPAAKTEARKQFERVTATADRKPSSEELAHWYGED